ncbi:tetratricopeptide repeat protein [Micromonospora maritima]|uniref:tetratricopeptide repeat protein n=1 Tax=Micromonospora maritima TaxID=986711 RepID=UPI00157D0DD0|nr:tetratricopeptide repeat protein [Micromonospora maritima]
MEPPPAPVEDAVARARDLVLAQEFRPAVALLRAHLRTHPDDSLAWRRLAGALIGLGDQHAAIDAAGRAIDADPGDTVAWRYRGLARHLLGRHRESYADARRAVDLAPDDPEGLNLLAVNVLTVDRDVARFRELYRRALTVDPSNAPARHSAGLDRRIRRRGAAALVLLAVYPPWCVLFLRWLAVDDGSTDAGWTMWPTVAGVAVLIVCAAVGRTSGVVPLVLTWRAIVGAACVGGAGAAGAVWGGTRTATMAAAFGLTAVAVSLLFALTFRLRHRRAGRLPEEDATGGPTRESARVA